MIVSSLIWLENTRSDVFTSARPRAKSAVAASPAPRRAESGMPTHAGAGAGARRHPLRRGSLAGVKSPVGRV